MDGWMDGWMEGGGDRVRGIVGQSNSDRNRQEMKIEAREGRYA